jgi:hypothetical protein
MAVASCVAQAEANVLRASFRPGEMHWFVPVGDSERTEGLLRDCGAHVFTCSRSFVLLYESHNRVAEVLTLDTHQLV